MLVLDLVTGKTVSIRDYSLRVEVLRLDEPRFDGTIYFYVVCARAAGSDIKVVLDTFRYVEDAFSYIDKLNTDHSEEKCNASGEQLGGVHSAG